MVLRDCRGEGRQGPAVARRLAYWRRHSSGSGDSSSSSTSARSASHATKDRRSLGLTERYKDFHSFRHTWKTAARGAELSEEYHDEISGHDSGSAGRSYGRVPVPNLKRAVDRVKFDRLKIPKWQ